MEWTMAFVVWYSSTCIVWGRKRVILSEPGDHDDVEEVWFLHQWGQPDPGAPGSGFGFSPVFLIVLPITLHIFTGDLLNASLLDSSTDLADFPGHLRTALGPRRSRNP